ncbi:MAG: hypothetical protein IT273_14635 [Chitinophagales bacterium]|nr:hypothetical protein [Chitinophagales bacterium]
MNCPTGFHEEIIVINGVDICVCVPNDNTNTNECPPGFHPSTITVNGEEVCICVPDDVECETIQAVFSYSIIGPIIYSDGVFDQTTGNPATSYTVNMWASDRDPGTDPPNYTFTQDAFPLGGWLDDDGDPTTPPISVSPATGLPLTEGPWTIIISNVLFGDCPASIGPIVTPSVEPLTCCTPLNYSGAGSGQSSGIMFSINPGDEPGNFYIDLGTCVVVDKVVVRNQLGVVIGETPYIGTVVPIAPTEMGFWTGDGIYPNNSVSGQSQSVRDALVPAWSLNNGYSCVLTSLTGQGRLTVPYDPAIDGTCVIEVTGNNLAYTIWGVNIICVGDSCDPCSQTLPIVVDECYSKHYNYIIQEISSGTGIFVTSVTHTANGVTTTYTPPTPIDASDTNAIESFIYSLPNVLYAKYWRRGRGEFHIIGGCDSNLDIVINLSANGTPLPTGTHTIQSIGAEVVKAFMPTFDAGNIVLSIDIPPGVTLDTVQWQLGSSLTLAVGTLTDTTIEVVPNMSAPNPDFNVSVSYNLHNCPTPVVIPIDLCTEIELECSPCVGTQISVIIEDDPNSSDPEVFRLTAFLLNGYLTVSSYSWTAPFGGAMPIPPLNGQTVIANRGMSGEIHAHISVSQCNQSFNKIVFIP